VSIQLPAPGADPLSDEWADTVAQLHGKGAITALVRELAIQSQCVAREHADGLTSLRLRVERESLCTDANRERLTQAIAQHLGHEVRIELERHQAINTPAQRDQVARELRQHQAENIIENDTLVKSLLAQYPGARIVPGSIRPV
jgi:DNA polymerase-3 subunit gamma/tau